MTTRDPRRLIEHIDTFFGVRNNIKGNPVENINYTLETLTYMTSHNRADQVTDLIVDRMKRINKVPFGVFECCAGIGGNALSFLENPATEWVVSYELRPERREMLRKNISMYNLSKKSFVPDEGFSGVPANYKGVVLYFDPPWLPEHIKGHESTKDQYILSGIKVGDKTLEEWITSCPNCAMVVARVPPGYKLSPIPGYDVEEVILKNSLVLIVSPAGTIPPEPKTEPKMLSDEIIPGVDQKERKWYEGLKQFILTTLEPIIPDPTLRNKMVTDEAMKTWVPCFTHESYNPNIGTNYEQLEFVGDHSMEYNFVMYVYLNYPGLTEAELSNLKFNYISKSFQSQIGQRMGFANWVRTRIPVSTHIFEDLIESFFGGLNLVGNEVFKFGAGTGLCYNLIIKIFEDIPIDMIYSKGKPKSVVKETFETLHWALWSKDVENIEEFKEGNNYTTIFTIKLTPAAIAWFGERGVKVSNHILASESGSTKKVASDNAYRVALFNLRNMGISEKMIDNIRENKDFYNPDLADLMTKVKEKTERNGYSSFSLKKIEAVRQGKYYQMIGSRPDGNLEILLTTQQPTDDVQAKIDLLNAYLQN